MRPANPARHLCVLTPLRSSSSARKLRAHQRPSASGGPKHVHSSPQHTAGQRARLPTKHSSIKAVATGSCSQQGCPCMHCRIRQAGRITRKCSLKARHTQRDTQPAPALRPYSPQSGLLSVQHFFHLRPSYQEQDTQGLSDNRHPAASVVGTSCTDLPHTCHPAIKVQHVGHSPGPRLPHFSQTSTQAGKQACHQHALIPTRETSLGQVRQRLAAAATCLPTVPAV